jgi:dTDP-4-amino-4,6-dideoxygalactose transaminase
MDDLRQEYLEAIDRVLKNGSFILGDEAAAFERRVAEYLGTKYAVGVNSGFSALVLALKALGIGPGDEVITVANSFVATVAAIELVGATTIFVDVGEDRNMDAGLLSGVLTNRTKAIIPVHLAGSTCNMTAILRFAVENGLDVIEDASQAFGAQWQGKSVGSFGAIGCFSLHPTKNLGACGDSGIMATNDPELYQKLSLLRNHGLRNRDECVLWGENSRLDEMQAAILNVNLNYIQKWNGRRRLIAKMYNERLKETDLIIPVEKPDEYAVYFTYIIQTASRDQLMDYLSRQGIECKIHYPIPIHHQKPYIQKYGGIILPRTDLQNRRILSLPLNTALTDSQIDYICEKMIDFLSGQSKF